MKRILTLLIFISFFQTVTAANGNESKIHPRLVIGIVVDQMRYDYLYRFYDQYSESSLLSATYKT